MTILEEPSENDTDLTERLLQQETEDSLSERPIQMTWYFFFTVAVVCIPMFLFGFNTGVLNAPESVIFPSHSVLEWSIAVSAFCAGGFFGANVTGGMSDKFGRRTALITILMSNIFFGMLHSFSMNMTTLIVARFGVGLAGGASTVLTPMYLSEISPKEIRGTIGTLTQLSCVLGILASILWALPFCTIDKWRYIFLPIPTMAIVGILSSPLCLPESPRWLLINHYVSRGQEAKNTMRRFRNLDRPGGEDEIEMEILQFLEAYRTTVPMEEQDEEEEVEEDEDNDLPMLSQMATTSFDDEIPVADEGLSIRSFRSYALDRRNRIPILSSLLFPVAQQLSGINAVFYYSTSFFSGVISDPQTGTIIAFSVNVVATIVALLLMDKLGRRTLLSWSAGGMLCCCVLLTFSQMKILPGFVTVLAVMLYISFFEIGLGCIPFFLASEMIEPEFLGSVQSFTMSLNWFSNFCVGIFFPYMDKFLGAYSFVPFAIVLFCTLLYSIFVLPETRGKSLSEVRQELNERQGVVSRSRESQTGEAETMLV